MSIIKSKRSLFLGLALALVVSAAAVAYWTTSGSGTGTQSTSAGAANLTVTQVSTLTAMYPGDTAQTLSAKVKNNADHSVKVDSLTASIDNVTKANGVTGTCDATDYTLTDALMIDGATELIKNAESTFSGAKLQFNNKAANQDACKGATVTIKYTVGSA